MSDEFDCDIVANNKADFVIARNIKSGYVPILLRGAQTLVSNMNFDIDTCCQKNDMFRVKLKKAQENLKEASSEPEKAGELERAFLDRGEKKNPVSELYARSFNAV